jgi:gliding motility-associated-like protein
LSLHSFDRHMRHPDNLHHRCLIFVACLLLLSAVSEAQTTFQRTYNTSDAGFFSTGLSVAAQPNGQQLWAGYVEKLPNPQIFWRGAVWATNQTGQVLNAWQIQPNELGVVASAAPAPDGDYVVVYQRADANPVPSVIRLNPLTGNVVWARSLTQSLGTIQSIRPTPGGWVLSGRRIGANDTDNFIIQLNHDGAEAWSTLFEDSDVQINDVATDAQGQVYAVGSYDDQGLLIKLSNSGGVIWTRRFESGIPGIFKAVQVSGNQVTVAGTVQEGTEARAWVMRTNDNGDLTWLYRVGLPNRFIGAVGLVVLPNGDVAVATNDQVQSISDGAAMFSIRPDGTLEWAYSYGSGTTSTSLSSMAVINNNQLALCGYQLAAGGFPFLMGIRTDQNGNVAGCCPNPAAMQVFPYEVSPVTMTLVPTFQTLTQTGSVEVVPLNPRADDICPVINTAFSLSDSTICPDLCITVNFPSPTPGVTYTWAFEGGTPATSNAAQPNESICYEVPGTYKVELLAEGCTAATLDIVVRQSAEQFPNAFTPDGDGNNDRFRPIVQCPVEEYHLEVFNRWGALVFESFDYDTPWDGTSNGEAAPVDVYVYRVQFYTYRDGVRTLVQNTMRDVLLLR